MAAEKKTIDKDLMNESFDALLVTVGVVGVSMVSKKVLGENLINASSLKDIAKLTAGVATSTMLVKYAQTKGWLPEDPFTKKTQTK